MKKLRTILKEGDITTLTTGVFATAVTMQSVIIGDWWSAVLGAAVLIQTVYVYRLEVIATKLKEELRIAKGEIR